MSKMIESLIECPFYLKEGERFINCEGLFEDTTVTHKFSTENKKREYEYKVCCANGGRKCPHFKNVSLLYERGVRF